MKTPTIPVSVRPYIHSGIEGYRVQWTPRTGRHKARAFFIRSRVAAFHLKARAKQGRLTPAVSTWAIRVL